MVVSTSTCDDDGELSCCTEIKIRYFEGLIEYRCPNSLRDVMRSSCLKTFVVLVLVLFVSGHTVAGVVNFSITGGPNSLISGTLGSNSFTNATWRVSTTADNSVIESFTSNSGFDLPTRVLPNTDQVTLEIFDNSSVYSATLTANLGFKYVVVSADFVNDPSGPHQGAGILHWDLGTNLNYGAGLFAGGSLGGTDGLYDSLTNLGSYVGGDSFFFDDSTTSSFTTSAGNLVLTGRSGNDSGGVWQSVVPEPSSVMIFGLGALGMAYRAWRNSMA